MFAQIGGHSLMHDRLYYLIMEKSDDETTIQEVKKYHSNGQYNWIYANRPRNQAARGGFHSHLPSQDAAYDFVAILAELKWASHCTKLVHGLSGFAVLLEDAMSDAAAVAGLSTNNITTFYLNTAVTKKQAQQGYLGVKKAGLKRGDQMVAMIDEEMQLQQKKRQEEILNRTTVSTGK